MSHGSSSLCLGNYTTSKHICLLVKIQAADLVQSLDKGHMNALAHAHLEISMYGSTFLVTGIVKLCNSYSSRHWQYHCRTKAAAERFPAVQCIIQLCCICVKVY